MFHQVIEDRKLDGTVGYRQLDTPLECGPNECLVANLTDGRVVVTDVPNLWRVLPRPKAKAKAGRPRKKPAAADGPALASDDEYPDKGPPEEEEEEEPSEEEEEEEPPEDDEAAEAARLLKRPATGLLKRPAAGLLKRPAAVLLKRPAAAVASAPNVEETPEAAPMTPEPEKKDALEAPEAEEDEALAAPEAEEDEAPAAPEVEEEEAPVAPEQLHRRSPKRSGPPVEYRLEKYRKVHAIGVRQKGGVQLFQFGGEKRAAHLTFRGLEEIAEEACRKLADDQPLEEVKLWAKSQLRQ